MKFSERDMDNLVIEAQLEATKILKEVHEMWKGDRADALRSPGERQLEVNIDQNQGVSNAAESGQPNLEGGPAWSGATNA